MVLENAWIMLWQQTTFHLVGCNTDTQINHFCLRNNWNNRNFCLILGLPVPKLSDMTSICLLFLHSTQQPNSLLKMLFSLSFTAPSSPGASQISLIFHSWLCPPHHVQLIFTLLHFPLTHSQINPSTSEPNSVDVLHGSHTCPTSLYPRSWLRHPHASL